MGVDVLVPERRCAQPLFGHGCDVLPFRAQVGLFAVPFEMDYHGLFAVLLTFLVPRLQAFTAADLNRPPLHAHTLSRPMYRMVRYWKTQLVRKLPFKIWGRFTYLTQTAVASSVPS
jgi:hypothetical protein